ncbi:MAG: MlaD family protein [Propionibacteriales bacterium]|nr:MlaD family protein [Propionibacteriales bacterium]
MNRRVHREDARHVLIGIVATAVAVVVAGVGVIVQGGGGLPLRSYTTVEADFDDVGTLKVGQRVSRRGVDIGIVTDVRHVDGSARVTMRLEGDVPVHADARARIGNESALGRKFVDLDPGQEESGDLGGRPIPVDRTSDAADLGDVLAAFPEPARDGLATGLQNVGGGLSGGSDDLYDVVQAAPGLLADVREISNVLSAPETDIVELLEQADLMAAQLRGSERDIASLVKGSGQSLGAVVVDDGGALRDTVRTAPGTLRSLTANLRRINPSLRDTASAARALRPGVDALVDATPDLRGVLRESGPTLDEAREFADEAVPGVRSLAESVPSVEGWLARLGTTLPRADRTLSVLSPFAPDIARLFGNHDLLSGNFAPDKHYFSIQLILPGLQSLGVPDPLVQVDPYSGPGGAFAGTGRTQ